MREHIVAEQQVRALAASEQLARSRAAKELHDRSNTLLGGHLSDIRGRLDPQHRDIFLGEVLQEVTIIAGNFNYEAIIGERKAPNHLVGVPFRMRQPTVREGCEV